MATEEQFGNLFIVGYPEEKKICVDFRHDISVPKRNETHEHWEIKSSSLGNFDVTSIQTTSGKNISSKKDVINFVDLGQKLGASVAALVIHILHVNYSQLTSEVVKNVQLGSG